MLILSVNKEIKMLDSIFLDRRKSLMQQLEPNSIAILKAAPQISKSHDIHFNYRQGPDFYYLTGYEQPDAIAIIAPKRIEGDFILFIREQDPKQTQWIGSGMTKAHIKEYYGAKEIFPMDQFIEMLPILLDGHKHVYYSEGHLNNVSSCIFNAIECLKKCQKTGTHPPTNFIDLNKIIHDMRLIKSTEEIELLRKAADITAQAHIRAMKHCKPNLYEYELRAEIIYAFYKQGASDEAFPTTVASGHNACTLHYTQNDQLLKNHTLVLVDAGAEYKHYNSDLSRTFPVNGHFTKYQRELYELVLNTQQAVIQLIKPAASLHDLQELAIYHIAEGLIKIGLLKGSIHDVIKTGAYKRFYMHNVSHWVGLNVHDDSTYKVDGHWRTLKPGMVLTVEPGLYIPNKKDIDIHWRGTGIRIEDVVLVTEKGAEVLTHQAPKTVNDIEKLMNS
jgi:Xaa-Pro aminopeptidase